MPVTVRMSFIPALTGRPIRPNVVWRKFGQGRPVRFVRGSLRAKGQHRAVRPVPSRRGPPVRLSRQFTAALLLCGAAIMLLCPVAPATAAVYACVASDGTTTYSDSPCDPNADRATVQPVSGRSPQTSTAGPSIQRALYVSPRNGHEIDVTGQLRATCSPDSGICAVSCNNQLAGDPDFGQRKYCKINYSCRGGGSQELRIQEGEKSTLSCPTYVTTPEQNHGGPADRRPAQIAVPASVPQPLVTAATPKPPAVAPSATPSANAVPPMKPGLWQVDQGDLSAASKPAMPDTVMRLCMTPELMSRWQTVVGKQPEHASCSPMVTTRRGDTTSYASRCRVEGTDLSTVVESSRNGDSIINTVDAMPVPGNPQAGPPVHVRTRMLYLGPDCRVNYPAPKEDTPARRLRYEVMLDADGTRHQLHTDYECRYESHDSTDGSGQYRSWTLNGSDQTLRVTDALSGGERLTVFPTNLYLQPWNENGGPCPAKATSVRSQVIAALGPRAGYAGALRPRARRVHAPPRDPARGENRAAGGRHRRARVTPPTARRVPPPPKSRTTRSPQPSCRSHRSPPRRGSRISSCRSTCFG